MAEYHVGCGALGVYVGTLNKKSNMWLHKSDVTNEAFDAVAQYCLEHDVAMNFNYKGKRYKLAVTEVKTESEKIDADNN